ncbi:MAG: glycosyltransferase [Microcystis panniformis Mp_MB_F_20051200_S9]|uniref:Glycosyltransferase n=1 Tax=Microcystis panniformis Mp_MB_F_20051200_S9 TaxID=2486223 RepID=A0A552PTM6_9CHRO|nr:MAG: glycosyltransferase [Microcystis panniformis Mp_MB_F_20080800_S26D]TRV45093.1 MAG: glycosyltransferase [Microcystis panniformis Mp_GB_SS_20050300_S99D]TRV45593.1 MAG: glycosyltransferase [Microcystis panniformis Mp_GB_SS_20050300_S99]TRV55175.1 MAG: glycosyltransferase [Microcystis panniformis Mp_MB_F_20080800_S26]TRV60339.1 MAG: glycosyltransferase [Microcystis panniformis Mp_MB_F_20051200_S9]TRV66652.1 MAG: glycosyltransferase [Microcystis panniformis Mp_MB_F_20051200_S9D]TRV71663.1
MLENKVMAAADPNEQIPTLELSLIMPCLNEAETLATCIGKARDYLERQQIAGEVLIADNGSGDGSQEIATNSGVRVVAILERGL